MAQLAYIVPSVYLDRETFLDLLEQLVEDGLLARPQAKTLATVSVGKLPDHIALAQRSPCGVVTFETMSAAYKVSRSGQVTRATYA